MMSLLKVFSILSLLVPVFASPLNITLAKRAQPEGIDVSGWQPNVNWNLVKSKGVTFAYIKATEGTNFKNSQFSSQYIGATNVGLIRGGYHFARPDVSTGAIQATYFANNGGGWSPDGITLPGVLDIEYNPYGATCYGKTQAAMVTWIKDFSNTYKAKTGVYPVIYTTTDWWKTCTGNNRSFGSTNPLWIARYAASVGTLPEGWSFHTFWQYSDSASPIGGDANVFNGDLAGLKRLARAAHVGKSGICWTMLTRFGSMANAVEQAVEAYSTCVGLALNSLVTGDFSTSGICFNAFLGGFR